jgi:hypothetical protein
MERMRNGIQLERGRNGRRHVPQHNLPGDQGRPDQRDSDRRGKFSIEPAELHRIFPPAPATSENHASNGAMNQGAMALGTADTGQLAQLESEIKAVRDMSALLREQLHETRHTVDDSPCGEPGQDDCF